MSPYSHSPSYYRPSSHFKFPKPFLLSNRQSPSQIRPSSHLKVPFPFILLSFHYPSYDFPSGQDIFPYPYMMFFKKWPSQIEPSAHTNFPLPFLHPQRCYLYQTRFTLSMKSHLSIFQYHIHAANLRPISRHSKIHHVQYRHLCREFCHLSTSLNKHPHLDEQVCLFHWPYHPPNILSTKQNQARPVSLIHFSNRY